MMTPQFDALGLSSVILSSLAEDGYVTPTPIQIGAIPPALEGKDVIGCAQTGTGKTAAYSLPVLERLKNETFQHDPRALVLAPTRELAIQVQEFLENYGRNTKLRSTVIVGGMPMSPQIKAIKKGCDVVIATPGRLLDLHHQRVLQLSSVKILILDEADRMLDMGFIPDVRHIMRLLARERQTLLFSATLPPEILRLANDFMRDPVRVEVAPSSTPVEKVRQVIHPVDPGSKNDLLVHLLKGETMEQVLVFTRTKRNAEKLGTLIEQAGMVVEVIHGDKHQKARIAALDAFKERRSNILIATDVASRGLDIEAISHVINYDMPDNVEDYIHRIGRTARASAHGDAVSLVSVEDWDVVKSIEKETGITIPRREVPGFEPKICRFLVETTRPDYKKPIRRRLLGRGRR